MQIIRRPVGRHVRTMTPNRTALHSAHGLPDVLPVGDLFRRNHDLAISGYDFARNRRRLTENFGADPAQYRKRKYKDCDENKPELFHENLTTPGMEGCALFKESSVDR